MNTNAVPRIAAPLLLAAAILVFHVGLRRYESGSAIQVEV